MHIYGLYTSRVTSSCVFVSVFVCVYLTAAVTMAVVRDILYICRYRHRLIITTTVFDVFKIRVCFSAFCGQIQSRAKTCSTMSMYNILSLHFSKCFFVIVYIHTRALLYTRTRFSNTLSRRNWGFRGSSQLPFQNTHTHTKSNTFSVVTANRR